MKRNGNNLKLDDNLLSGGGVAEPRAGRHAAHGASRDERGRDGLRG